MAGKRYSLIGYAYGQASKNAGSGEAPRVLRELKLLERLRAGGITIEDLGDAGTFVDPQAETHASRAADASEKLCNNLASTYSACSQLAAKTRAALEGGTTPVIIGGDHSLSVGSVAAVANHLAAENKKIGLLWIDTHADINTPETSPSKNIYGMSVAFLSGLIPGVLSSLQSSPPAVELENMAYIGVRDLDPGERKLIREKNILTFTMKEIDMLGMPRVAKEAIEHVCRNTAGFVVSFDLDACDPQLAPGTGTPVRGGLTYREAHLLLELIVEDGRMLSFELMELNPKLDKDFVTAEVAMSLIETALGKTIL